MRELRDLRTFGRRHGRRPSRRQGRLLRDLLPKLALDLTRPPPWPLTALFPVEVDEVWLEIGFGGGEHLAWQARHHRATPPNFHPFPRGEGWPRVGLIGCEPFVDGVTKVLSALDTDNLDNVRLYADDARVVLRWLPPASLGRVFVLFPDPWPKRRHAKRRLFSTPLLDELARVMKSGGELRLATDVGEYARTSLIALRGHPHFCWPVAGAGDWRARSPDWPPTRYETKAAHEGRRCYYFRFVRR
jgi:tRNA (guanine-N7-)-methyltransferase